MITVYSKNNCPKCVQAKNVLTANGREYLELNVDEDEDAYNFILSVGHKSLPQIYSGGKLFVESVAELLRLSREGKLK